MKPAVLTLAIGALTVEIATYNPQRFCRCPILSSLRNSKQIHWCPLLQSITMEVPNSLLCGEQNVTMEPLLIHCSLLYRVLFFVVAFFPTEGHPSVGLAAG